MKIFVYETLKHHRVQNQALGHEKATKRAVLPGYLESVVQIGKEFWPTIIPRSGKHVMGDIFVVDPKELEHLDKWEDHYTLREVTTSDGPAWAYFYEGKPD